MFDHRNVTEAVEAILFGPTVEDIQHMIDPDPMSRLVGQLVCEHSRRDWLLGMCRDCGVTDAQVRRAD